MNLRSYTEEVLAELRAMPKRATNPQARWLDKPKAAPSHRQRSIQVQGEGDALFAIYQRESLQDPNDFVRHSLLPRWCHSANARSV